MLDAAGVPDRRRSRAARRRKLGIGGRTQQQMRIKPAVLPASTPSTIASPPRPIAANGIATAAPTSVIVMSSRLNRRNSSRRVMIASCTVFTELMNRAGIIRRTSTAVPDPNRMGTTV